MVNLGFYDVQYRVHPGLLQCEVTSRFSLRVLVSSNLYKYFSVLDISTKIHLLSTKSDVSLKSKVIFHHNGPEGKYNVETDLDCS